MKAEKPALEAFFSPRSLVVYGATDDADKVGGRIFSLLQRYDRPVYPIHPSLDLVAGSPVYRSAGDLPEVPDLAVLAVSARHCGEALRDALGAGTKAAILLAAGFGETGREGLESERRLVSMARSHGARILGPNTLGLFLPHLRLDTIFVEHGDRSLLAGGSIAVISQSGSVGVEALGYASASGFGLRAFVGLGNKSDLNEMDMAEWFSRDRGAHVLGFYLEDLVDGRRFLVDLARVAIEKPVVVLKGGRTAAGAHAAASHTGTLAAKGRVAEGAWRQFGIHRVRDDQHFCDTCKVLALCPPMEGTRVAIITPAGGYGVMAVDSLASLQGPAGLSLAELSAETIERLREVLLPFASPRNPVDLTAACTDETYEAALDILMEAPEVDALLVVAFFAPEGVSSRLVNIIATKNRQSRKPMVVFSLHGPFTDRHLLEFHDRGVAAFGSMSRAVDALVALRERRVFLSKLLDRKGEPDRTPINARTEELLSALLSRPSARKALDEAGAKALLSSLGFRVPRHVALFPEVLEEESAFAIRSVEAVRAAGLSAPVVLKVLSGEILHKSDVGGVRKGIQDDPELERAIQTMRADLCARGFTGHGILVEEQVETVVEAIVGGLNDPEFGPSVMLGLGGVWSESLQDVSFRVAPVTRQDVEEMLDELRSAQLFRSFRGFDFPREDFIALVVLFSRFFHQVSDRIDQIDLNPVAAGPAGLTVLDAKVLLR